MLDNKENIILAKLIGLLNGIDEYELNEQFIKQIKYILNCLKKETEYDQCIQTLIDLKKTYLSSCATCISPCGRTNDYSINDIENEALKEERIKEYNLFIQSYNDSISIDDIIYNICKLGW